MKNKFNIPFYDDGCTEINDIPFDVNSICFEISNVSNYHYKFRIIDDEYYGMSIIKKYNHNVHEK